MRDPVDLFRTRPVEALGDAADDVDLTGGRLRKALRARHLVGFGTGVVSAPASSP